MDEGGRCVVIDKGAQISKTLLKLFSRWWSMDDLSIQVSHHHVFVTVAPPTGCISRVKGVKGEAAGMLSTSSGVRVVPVNLAAHPWSGSCSGSSAHHGPRRPAGADQVLGHVPCGGSPFQLAEGDGLLLQRGDQIVVPHLVVDYPLRTTNPATGFHVDPVQRRQQLRRLGKLEGLTVGIPQRQLLTLAGHLQGQPLLLVGGSLRRRPMTYVIPVGIDPDPLGVF